MTAVSSAEIRKITDACSKSLCLQDLRKITGNDPQYQKLKHYIIITHRFPTHRHQLPDKCRRYWNMYTRLSVEDDLILLGCRLLIPTKMCRDVLMQLHDSHQDIVRTKERARLVVYWPGLKNDNIILSCQTCQDALPSNHREPNITKPSTP